MTARALAEPAEDLGFDFDVEPVARPIYQLDLFAGQATWQDVVEGYLDGKVDVRRQTIDEYRSATRRIWRSRPDLANLDVSLVDIPHLIEIRELFLNNRGAHRAARCAIAQALDWAASLGLRPHVNPARTRYAKGYKHRSKRPSQQLIEAFFPAIDTCERRSQIFERDADFYRLATLTGLRHRELIRLRIGDVDLEARTLIVRMKQRSPNDSIDEEFPIGAWAAEILSRRIGQARDGWLFPAPRLKGHMRKAHMWERWPPILLDLEARGIDVLDRVTGTKIVPTVTRSIAAKIRDRAGVSLIVSQRSMGHRRLQTTASYCPPLEEEVREAMMLIETTLQKTVMPPGAEDSEDRIDRARETGSRIAARRRLLRISQKDAAERYREKTGQPLTRQGWKYWEEHGCGLAQVDDVAEVLRISPKELLGFG